MTNISKVIQNHLLHVEISQILHISSSSKHPSVSRDNGKASLLGVETQRSYFSQGMCRDKKIEK